MLRNTKITIAICLIIALGGCTTLQIHTRTAIDEIEAGTLFINHPSVDTIVMQEFSENIKDVFARRGHKITQKKAGAKHTLNYVVQNYTVTVQGAYVLPEVTYSRGYVGNNSVSVASRQMKQHSWSVDVPETLVEANMIDNATGKILWEGQFITDQETFKEKAPLLAKEIAESVGLTIEKNKSF